MKIMRAGLLLGLALFAQPALAEEMTVVITNSHTYAVELELYSEDRDHVWPGNGQVYLLDDGEEKTVPISCNQGERICYGAWISGDADTYWGVGPNATESCSDCCYVCNGGETESINLVE
jgi:hypothetical protein